MDTSAQPNPSEEKPKEETTTPVTSFSDLSATPAATPPPVTPSSSPFASTMPTTPINETTPHHGHAAYYLLALSLLLIGFVMGYFAKTAISPSVQNIPVPSPTEVMQQPTAVPTTATQSASPSVAPTTGTGVNLKVTTPVTQGLPLATPTIKILPQAK